MDIIVHHLQGQAANHLMQENHGRIDLPQLEKQVVDLPQRNGLLQQSLLHLFVGLECNFAEMEF